MISKDTASELRRILSPTFAERLKSGETSVKIAVGGGIFLLAILMVAAILWLNGFALQYLWGLFIVPVFKLPALTVAQAIGVVLVSQFLTKHLSKDDPKKDKDEPEADAKTKAKSMGAALLKPFMKPLSFMAAGWVLHTLSSTI